MENNNQNSAGELLATTAFSILKHSTFFKCIVVVGAIMATVLFVTVFGGGGKTSASEAINNAGGGNLGCIREDGQAWAAFISDEKNAVTFYNKFNTLLKENPDVDFNTAVAILTYAETPDVGKQYACNTEVKDDAGKVEIEECSEALVGSTKSSTALYNDAKKVVSGLASTDGSDESAKKWMQENYLEDKLKELGYDVSKLSEQEKQSLLERKSQEVIDLRNMYKDMTCNKNNNICSESNSIDSSTRKKARFTTYQYDSSIGQGSLGGLGSLQPYIKAGTVYFDDNNFAFWKGGNRRLNTSQVYGEAGKDYLIIAAAHKALIGHYGYEANGLIRYYTYGDTFSVTLTVDGTEKTYNAIILDACGACMDWSPTSNGQYRPKTDKDKQYCTETNYLKLDILTNRDGAKSKSDTGYVMDGTSTNSSCIVSGTFDNWKQVDSRWKDIRMGNSSTTVGKAGCLITSVSIQIMRSGTQLLINDFNPGKAAKYFDFQGDLFAWNVTKVAPNFIFQSKINMEGRSKSDQMATIKNLLDQGYYIVANVKNGGHWVAVTGVTSETITMSDPGHFNATTDLYAAYPSSSTDLKMVQIAYFKANDRAR